MSPKDRSCTHAVAKSAQDTSVPNFKLITVVMKDVLVLVEGCDIPRPRVHMLMRMISIVGCRACQQVSSSGSTAENKELKHNCLLLGVTYLKTRGIDSLGEGEASSSWSFSASMVLGLSTMYCPDDSRLPRMSSYLSRFTEHDLMTDARNACL
jgi:hypothetical protein